jgi:hypothetical protein
MRKLLIGIMIIMFIFTLNISAEKLPQVYEPQPDVKLPEDTIVEQEGIFFDVVVLKGKSMITKKAHPRIEFYKKYKDSKFDINITIKSIKKDKVVENYSDKIEVKDLVQFNESYFWTERFNVEPGKYIMSLMLKGGKDESYSSERKFKIPEFSQEDLVLAPILSKGFDQAKKEVPAITMPNGYNFYPAIDLKIDKSKKEKIAVPFYIFGLTTDVQYNESEYKMEYQLIHLPTGKQLLKTQADPKTAKVGAFDTFLLPTEKIIPAIYELRMKLFDIKGDRTVEKKLTFEIVESKDNKKSE